MQVRVSGTAPRLVTIFFAALLALIGGFAGYLVYSTTRDAVAQAQFALPAPEQIVPKAVQIVPTVQTNNNSNQQKNQNEAVVPQQQQVNRLNILVVGLDVSDQEAEAAARADSIIIISVDPTGGPIGMLSIPRDLWVPIGSYGESRINTAYFLGEVKEYPGGGPGLLKATIEQNFAIPIDYYVVIDFSGFEELIDQVGGVTINVEKEIYDNEYPDGKGGTMVLTIPAGKQKMDGKTALQYARARHTTSDFDRAKRQQELLMALRDQIMGKDNLATLITRLPGLYGTLSRMVKTDLSLDEIIRLARIASGINMSNIESAVIDQTMTTRYITDKGWDVLLPIPEKINPVIERLFKAPLYPNGEPELPELEANPQVTAEGATILLSNGSGKEGLATAAADYLRTQGFDVKEDKELGRGDYSSTVVVTYSEKPQTIAALCAALNVPVNEVRTNIGGSNPDKVDIKVILGQSFVLPAK